MYLSICPCFSVVAGASAGDRGAAEACGLPEHDPGPQSPSHGSQHSLHRGGMSGWVPPAPVQRVSGWEQACQRCAAQRWNASAPRKDWKIRIAGFLAETASPFCVQPQPVRNVPNLNYAEESHCQYHWCHTDIWATIFFWCQFWVLSLWWWPTDTFPIYRSWFSVGDVMIALALQLNT